MHAATRPTVVILLLVGVALPACSGESVVDTAGSTASREIMQRIEVDTMRTQTGQAIAGRLVIVNPGPPINLSHGCRPGYTVVLTNSNFPVHVSWPTSCAGGPFMIPTGSTGLSVIVGTTYTACAQAGGTVTPSTPACLRGGQMPPLPTGNYDAVAAWSEKVPLPAAQGVPVTLVHSGLRDASVFLDGSNRNGKQRAEPHGPFQAALALRAPSWPTPCSEVEEGRPSAMWVGPPLWKGGGRRGQDIEAVRRLATGTGDGGPDE